jgi:hypothetical protein
MSPNEFLVLTEVISALKQKASLPEITPAQAKFLRLDLSPTLDDITITDYYKRTSEVINSSGIQVMVTFEQAWRTHKLE